MVMWLNRQECIFLKRVIVMVGFWPAGCEAGSFGISCARSCDCAGEAPCDPTTGQCLCPPGWTGERCEKSMWTSDSETAHIVCLAEILFLFFYKNVFSRLFCVSLWWWAFWPKLHSAVPVFPRGPLWQGEWAMPVSAHLARPKLQWR